MADDRSIARRIIEQLEHGAVGEVSELLSEERRRSVGDNDLRRWSPAMDNLIGSPRRVSDTEHASDNTLVLEGPKGRLLVRVGVDTEQRVVNVELTPLVTDGIRNIVIAAPRGTWNEEEQRVEGPVPERGTFYAELLGMRILRDDWIVVGSDMGTYPRLAFGDGWSNERPPRWPDPSYPHHLHLDLFARDVDATTQRAVALGARRAGEGHDHRTLIDPVGHPFCVYEDRDAPDERPRVGRLVFDCPDPRALAAFYTQLFDMQQQHEGSDERVVVGRADGVLPMLGFQRVHPYVEPRWQDPMYPQPIHLDTHFNDHDGAKRLVERLGATEVPPPRGSCPVYTDPAGHPFCLCSNGGGDEPYVAQLFG